MAFDGITIAGVVAELQDKLLNGRIYKIAQPETDELLITIKNNKEQYRLMLSADASLPLIYLTDKNKQSPMTAPNFCMLLRKHLQNARIISIEQPGMERIVRMGLEHLDEMGDVCRKYLIIEIMGKHSNIIFCNQDNIIIDSIKHISSMVSSVREVLPGREYFVPKTQDKVEPLTCSEQSFVEIVNRKNQAVFKAIYGSFTGISPVIAHEICYRAQVDSDKSTSELDETEWKRLAQVSFWIRIPSSS